MLRRVFTAPHSTISDFCTNLNMMRQKYLVQVTQGYALHVTCGNIKKHQREMLQLKEEKEEAVKKIAPSL